MDTLISSITKLNKKRGDQIIRLFYLINELEIEITRLKYFLRKNEINRNKL